MHITSVCSLAVCKADFASVLLATNDSWLWVLSTCLSALRCSFVSNFLGGQRLPAGYVLGAWRTVSSKAMSGKQDRHGCKKVTLVTAKTGSYTGRYSGQYACDLVPDAQSHEFMNEWKSF